jgi:hypothetical protein
VSRSGGSNAGHQRARQALAEDESHRVRAPLHAVVGRRCCINKSLELRLAFCSSLLNYCIQE